MAIVDTLGIADELARDGVFSREQAERLARVSGRVAVDALVTEADLEAATTVISTQIELLRKEHPHADFNAAVWRGRHAWDPDVGDGVKEKMCQRSEEAEELERRGIKGLVYGESSTFHIYLEGPGANLPVSRPEDYRWLDPVTLKSMDPGLVRALQNGFRVRGVELLSYNGGMTSAAHEESDIDETVDVFDDLVGELVKRGALARR